MVNQNQIRRLVELRSYGRLIERLLPAGRCRSDQAVCDLCRPEASAAAAIGLALQRCCELSYTVTPATKRLADSLAVIRRGDGLFGDGEQPSVGASAVAIRAMLEWSQLCERSGHGSARLGREIDRSIRALAQLQDDEGLIADNPVGSAIALSMLGDQSEFQQSVNVPHLESAIDRSGTVCAQLGRYAHAMAA